MKTELLDKLIRQATNILLQEFSDCEKVKHST